VDYGKHMYSCLSCIRSLFSDVDAPFGAGIKRAQLRTADGYEMTLRRLAVSNRRAAASHAASGSHGSSALKEGSR